MIIDEDNVHEFEAELINSTAPKLYLEPTSSLEESIALIDSMTPTHFKCPPPAPKVRKRTTAELAADEAEAADVQRFMLAGDERQSKASGTATNNDEGQPGTRGQNAFEPRFSRFKTLESIKMHHEETERRKKEEEARNAQMKAQQRQEAETQKRQAEANARQAEQNRAIMQRQQQEQMQHQRQEQQQTARTHHLQQQQQEALRAASQAPQMPNQAAQFNQVQHQPQHSSPVVRQQTPLTSSPALNAHNMASHPMTSASMAATSSSHGAGSPPRPASAVSHHPLPMARNMSQQHSGQGLSRNGTPQMVQGTPIMNTAMPARNMTPQPRMQGSPIAGMQGTPTMMSTPSGQLTAEQMNMMQRRNQIARMQQAQMNAGMQASPNQNFSLEQMALMHAQQSISQNGVPPGEDPRQHEQVIAHRYLIRLQERQKAMQLQAGSPQNGVQMRPTPSQHGTPPIPGLPPNYASQDSGALRQEYARRKRQIHEVHGGQVPPQVMAQMRQLEQAIRNSEMREGGGGGNPGQPTMNAQAMHAMGINVAAGQQPSQQQMQAMMLRQRQLQQQQQAQQFARMQQNAQQLQTLQQQGGQMNMGGMANNMNGMINANGMNSMNGMGMGQLGMGQMGGMQGMGMGAAGGGGMTMQQYRMQQMAMAQRNQQRRQQPQQGDGGMEWNGT
jgi:transcription factor SPT20